MFSNPIYMYASLKMHMPLERGIHFPSQVWALVLSYGSFPNLLLRLTIRSCIVINKIVSSSRPRIPDFGRYKMGCLHTSQSCFLQAEVVSSLGWGFRILVGTKQGVYTMYGKSITLFSSCLTQIKMKGIVLMLL